MIADDSLLLSDLERIAGDIRVAMELQEHDDYEFPQERIKIYASDLARVMTSLRRASRELIDLRERLERRLKI